MFKGSVVLRLQGLLAGIPGEIEQSRIPGAAVFWDLQDLWLANTREKWGGPRFA